MEKQDIVGAIIVAMIIIMASKAHFDRKNAEEDVSINAAMVQE